MRALILVSTLLAACTFPRTEQFRSFGETGRVYVHSIEYFLAEVSELAVASDSEVLLAAREGSPAEREARVAEHTQRLLARLRYHAALQRQTRLLGQYFEGIVAITERANSTYLSAPLARIVRNLAAIESTIAAGQEGSGSPQITNFDHYPLQYELEVGAETVTRALALQAVAFQNLADSVASDAAVWAQDQGRIRIVIPYSHADELHDDWKEQRRRIIGTVISADSAILASDTANSMLLGFIAVTERRLTDALSRAIARDCGRLDRLTGRVRRASTPDAESSGTQSTESK
jgi:hypothetical protein